MTQMDIDVSEDKCRQGQRIAMYHAKYSEERERPCYIIGMVDGIEYWPEHFYFDFKLHEGNQTRKSRFYLN